jgi:hypothetical protein
MGNPNKFGEGMDNILFPTNIGFPFCGYNFPESTAQDLGSLSMSFSGDKIPYSASLPYGYGYGPSGYDSDWTVLKTLNDRLIYAFNGVSSFTAVSVDPGTPDLNSIFPPGTFRVEAQRGITSITTIETLDLISEGPIEGFVSGLYIPNLSGKTTGDIGYTSVTFQPYEQKYSNPETRSIYWDDTPITDLQGFYNFTYADYKFTYGEKTNDHTTYNPYLNLYENRYSYFGRKVDQNDIPLETSVTKSINERLYGAYLISGNYLRTYPKSYYIYNTDVSALKINIKINGLAEQILSGTNAGDIERKAIEATFALYRLLDDGTVVALDTSKYAPYILDNYSKDAIYVNGKITTPVIFTYQFNIRPFSENQPFFPLFPNQIGWVIDIVRTSLEGIGSSNQASTSVDSITEIYSDRFVYPDAALVWSKFDARYFTSVPSRSYKVRLLKVKIPVNYDPIAKKYDGPWNGKFKVAWTDNPAWCFYDLISSNRYGLGKYINESLVDKWTLYEISQYCDELVSDGFGGLEPRFRCNILISSKEEAYKVLNDMASVFRAIIYYAAGQVAVSQDSLKEPIYLFNNSNVIDGVFNYSDASKKSRKTVALVRYNDENNNYKPAIEYVEDKTSILKYGIKETDIVAFGCTNKNQAKRIGKWLIVTDNTETETVNFAVGLEGNYVRPGDVILLYDQDRKNQVYAGRTLELTTGYAILDTPYNSYNTFAITGVNSGFNFNIVTSTYNVEYGTTLGDLYYTGFSNITSSGITGLNSSFYNRSHIQNISFNNASNYLTSGSGIYSNNIRINFPTNVRIPEVVGAGMSAAGNVFTKTAATAAWDSQVYSTTAYNNNMFAEAKANQTNAAIMFGLNSDPILNANFTSLDYAWYFAGGGILQIWESSKEIGTFGSYTTSTKLRINYDGEWITYLKDNVIMRAVPVATQGQALYFDSSFFTQGGAITANYGTFALSDYLKTLSPNTVWTIDIDPNKYNINQGLDIRSKINNISNTAYPGYYLEPYLNDVKKYRILNITESENSLFNITALEYNDQKYKDIDNIATLVNVPVRPSLPITPTLFLSGIFRNSSDSYCTTDPCDGRIYTTNQGGINSIMYNIQSPAISPVNSLYYVYVKSGTNFTNQITESAYLQSVLSSNLLKTGLRAIDWINGAIPPFFTPLYTGSYYFRVFAENSVGERSTAATGLFTLRNQASVFSVSASGRNIF